MAEPRLIHDYLAGLSAQLPAAIVDELAGGLTDTYRCYLRQGQAPDTAARSAVAEFGEPRVIVAAFARVHPTRRTARRLLATGPAVGTCWAAVLITGQAWQWPTSVPARILLGLMLIIAIGSLAAGAFGTHYQLAARAGIVGCAGIAALDTAMITGAMFVIPSITWITMAALAASTVRVTFSGRALGRLIAGVQS